MSRTGINQMCVFGTADSLTAFQTHGSSSMNCVLELDDKQVFIQFDIEKVTDISDRIPYGASYHRAMIGIHN